MDAILLLQFWGVGILLALTPGPDWAYSITVGLGAPRIWPSILGMLCGYALMVAAIAIGLGALVTTTPVALTTLTLVGACYLLWVGVATSIRRAPTVARSEHAVDLEPWAQFSRGVGVSGLNPKGLVLLLILLPQFTASDGWPLSLQILALGGVHLINCGAVYSVVAHSARRILRSRPGASRVVTKLAGVSMIAIGSVMLIERVGEFAGVGE